MATIQKCQHDKNTKIQHYQKCKNEMFMNLRKSKETQQQNSQVIKMCKRVHVRKCQNAANAKMSNSQNDNTTMR